MRLRAPEMRKCRARLRRPLLADMRAMLQDCVAAERLRVRPVASIKQIEFECAQTPTLLLSVLATAAMKQWTRDIGLLTYAQT